jgi:hypothetical protein
MKVLKNKFWVVVKDARKTDKEKIKAEKECE